MPCNRPNVRADACDESDGGLKCPIPAAAPGDHRPRRRPRFPGLWAPCILERGNVGGGRTHTRTPGTRARESMRKFLPTDGRDRAASRKGVLYRLVPNCVQPAPTWEQDQRTRRPCRVSRRRKDRLGRPGLSGPREGTEDCVDQMTVGGCRLDDGQGNALVGDLGVGRRQHKNWLALNAGKPL